ncbi:hypothetical protein WAK64_08260 [Bacillus spongiae]|uniref:Uncharacterized protein n=1 Tax=Bacillus spongiae TaxID=2683610 RepID=A0ABU8HCX5_9BACI
MTSRKPNFIDNPYCGWKLDVSYEFMEYDEAKHIEETKILTEDNISHL